ncbi:MAG TPA: type II toxin-antitoxin system VapC family toxin [Terriglobales bacterium]|nr:type II toxin-antitoxin system VapC family toxin [Terriglobales bacterium]
MIILDTNVLSGLMLEQPPPQLIGWTDRQPRTSIWTTAVNVFEVRYGLAIMPEGRRRELLQRQFDDLLEAIDHRIALFDEVAAEHTAALMALRRQAGRSGELRDAMIAGIVLAHHATLATRNVAPFADLDASVINPWDV